jgi:HAD superfamily hydrolase (TIGR01490 family)
MKKFAAFDIDGTIFRSGLYREIVYELLSKEQIPADIVKEFADLETDWRKRRSDNAFKNYEQAMAEAVDKVLPQIKIVDFEKAAVNVFERLGEYVYAYTRDLVAQLKSEGYTMIAISGSQEELVKPFAEKYGFDIWIGQHYSRGEEYFTGEIHKTHNGKDVILRQIVFENGLDFSGSIAVGDSKGDIGMLSIVENPIAFNPEKGLFEEAKKQGWKIVVERKNMVYEMHPHEQYYVLA